MQDVLQRGDGLDPFDLGDQQGIRPGGAQQFARQAHVGAGLGEGDGDEIACELRRGADVLHVLGGERRRREAAALLVDALVVGQHAADAHAAAHFALDDRVHFEDDAAVVEQQHVAGGQVVDQVRVVEADARRIAGRARRIEDEAAAGLEFGLAGGELADANLGALQVDHDADGAADLAHDLAQQRDALAVVVGRAVGEVQPHDIDAGGNHPRHHLRIGAGRAEGGDDFG